MQNRSLVLKSTQGSISTPRPKSRRGREVDRQLDPGHENGRETRLQGGNGADEPSCKLGLPAGH